MAAPTKSKIQAREVFRAKGSKKKVQCILRKICEIGSFEVRIISPCGTFCQFGEGTIPCPSHHLFRQGVQLNNSANVSNHFQIGGGMGVLGYNKNCVAQKNFFHMN